MAILKVARLGHPVLRQVAEPVKEREIQSSAFQSFLNSMIETMREYDGVGLAAPQVHTSLQVAVLEVEDNPRYPDMPSLPLKIMINPKVTILEDSALFDWEGCLSVPNLRGKVPRAIKLKIEAIDRHGQPYSLECEGFHARVIQHEYDHLLGQVYLDRMSNMQSLSFLKEFQRYWSIQDAKQEPS